jgi:hypothetical protein
MDWWYAISILEHENAMRRQCTCRLSGSQ